jgi:hypothetical protein
MSLSTDIKLNISTTETLTGDDLVANSQLLHSGYDVNQTLDGTTTPDITKAAYQTFTLVAGAKTIDLTDLLLNAAAVTFSGLKPRAIRFRNTGAAAMTIAKGASNGYTGLGSAFSLTLQPGQSQLFYLHDQGTAVSGSVKTFDVSGTGTDTLQFSAVAGT